MIRAVAPRNTIMKHTFSLAALTIALAGAYSSPQAQVALGASTTSSSAAPSVLNAGAYAVNRQIGEMTLTLSTATLAADGQSSLTVDVTVLDRKGNPVQGEVLLTVETSAGRLLLAGARTDELGPGRLDADRAVPGAQLKVVDGRSQFKIIAPSMPQQGMVRITGGSTFAESQISFIPEARDWMVVGLVEGIVSMRRVKNESAITGLRSNDGFDEALRTFEREFSKGDNKAGTAAARAAFFVKGTVTGKTLLTASYDSDKETRLRLLRDVSVDQIYPVFGDASLKSSEAKSAQKLYVRLDNGKNYLLYGDFQTSDGFSQSAGTGSVASVKQRDLGNTSRSMTGIRAHLEGEGPNSMGFVNVYAAKDSLNQLVEEKAGNGGSFYNLQRADALENTEKLEVIVRDRNNPGRVLNVLALQRFADYTFEPFNGRVLLAAPLQSTDAQGNPQTLRISYEVDQGGTKFLVAGIDGQLNIGNVGQIGGSYLKDKNPLMPTAAGERKLTELASVNVGINLGNNAKAVLEAAQSKNTTSTGEVEGRAIRAEIVLGKAGDGISGVAFYGKADPAFYNPNASINEGREEVGIKLAAKVTQDLTLKAEATQSKDRSTVAGQADPKRKGAYLGAEYAVNDSITVNAGVRKAQDNGSGLYGPTQSASTSLYGAGGLFTPSGTASSGSQTAQVGTATGAALDTTTLQLGVKAKITPTLTLGLEGEGSVNGDKATRAAATAEWQVAERTKLNARYETQTGLGSQYDRSDKSNALVLGVTNTYLNSGTGTGNGGAQGEMFSEYRLRDAINGRESQLASGLRNTFEVSDGLRAVAGAEYIKVLNGAVQPALALAGGLDYTGSDVWKGSARLEWRKAQATPGSAATPTSPAIAGLAGNTGIMSTLSLARKLDRDWTALARNYYATTDSTALAGKQMQDRLQVGFAYRPVDADRFDALGKLEYKIEKNGESVSGENRRAITMSLSTNWHPSRDWWVSGRLAAKNSTETYADNNGSGLTTRSKFTATMLSARAIYDVTSRWDVGVLASVLQGQGAKQYAYGLETGLIVKRNLWLSVGYNFAGFTDRDLTGNEYTAKGVYVRLRAKFNQTLFDGDADNDTIVTK
jgi:hypothetical protein